MRSYFIDTNYFLRLLLRDNEKQFKKVYSLFQQAIEGKVKIYTSVIVFFEINWVLSSFYKKDKKKIAYFLENILKMNFLEIENHNILQQAIIFFKNYSLDLEDCYNIALAKSFGLDEFATFDKKIARMLNK